MKKLLQLCCLAFFAIALAGCSQGNRIANASEGQAAPIKYSAFLSLTDFDDYSVATIRNPWDTTRILHTYVLLPDSAQMPEALPQGTVVRTPLRRSVVYSSVHNSLISELGAMEAISGVCDAQYITQPEVRSRIANGYIADCGNSMAPNLEQVIALQPGAILLSPYESNNGYGPVEQIGIPIIECADYMETSPLGRAEWVKLYGRLYGREEAADSMFDHSETEYLKLKGLTANVAYRPQVVMDLIWSSTWHQPASNSTMGIYLWDAGAQSVAQDVDKNGSIGFTPEEVLYRAQNADAWLMRYAQSTPMTLKQLAKDNEIYQRFKPYKTGEVYGCNTQEVDFYEDTPFHPERLLGSFIALLHPELADSVTDAPVYFSKLN